MKPLLNIMSREGNKESQILNRAFAAIALGRIGERGELPALSKISTDINYRAQVDSIKEVLDIL